MKLNPRKAVLVFIHDHSCLSYQVVESDMTGNLYSGCTSPREDGPKRISTEIIRQIAQADCCIVPYETDASQYGFACALCLNVEDMLNP